MNDFLQIFPVLATVFSAAMIVLNLWLNNKLNTITANATKTKHEILDTLRSEFKLSIKEVESKTVTKEQMDFFNERMRMMFRNLARQLKLSTKDFDDDEE